MPDARHMLKMGNTREFNCEYSEICVRSLAYSTSSIEAMPSILIVYPKAKPELLPNQGDRPRGPPPDLSPSTNQLHDFLKVEDHALIRIPTVHPLQAGFPFTTRANQQ